MRAWLRWGWLVAALLGAGTAWADSGGGLVLRDGAQAWPKWQGRLSLGLSGSSRLRLDLPRGDMADIRCCSLNQVRLMGDYYFTGPLLGQGVSGGFRATSGVVMGPRGALLSPTALPARSSSALSLSRVVGGVPSSAIDGPPDIGTVPYLGVGYTGILTRSGLSFSADFGLAAMNPGSGLSVGRMLSGNQGLDDLLHELQLRPVVQVGVSYSF